MSNNQFMQHIERFCFSFQSSGAFVYGFIGFFDKVFSGAIFKIIQDLNPEDEQRWAFLDSWSISKISFLAYFLCEFVLFG